MLPRTKQNRDESHNRRTNWIEWKFMLRHIFWIIRSCMRHMKRTLARDSHSFNCRPTNSMNVAKSFFFDYKKKLFLCGLFSVLRSWSHDEKTKLKFRSNAPLITFFMLLLRKNEAKKLLSAGVVEPAVPKCGIRVGKALQRDFQVESQTLRNARVAIPIPHLTEWDDRETFVQFLFIAFCNG